jgi:HAMP domain-containing protein
MNLNFRGKVIITLTIFVVTISLVFVFASSYVQDLITRMDADELLTTSENTFYRAQKFDVNMLDSTIEVIISDDTLKDLFLEEDRDSLYEATKLLFGNLKNNFRITHFYFHLPSGYNFLRVHNQDIYGDEITRFTFDNARDQKEVSSGIELGKTAFALRVVRPYYQDDQLIGYVELGEEIEHFLPIMKNQIQSDLALVIDKQYLDQDKWASVRTVAGLENNWDHHENHIVIDSTIEEDSPLELTAQECFSSANAAKIQIKEEKLFIDVYQQEGNDYICGGFPVYDAGNRLVGAMMIFHDSTDMKVIESQVRYLFLILAIVLLLAGSNFYYFLIYRQIIKPIGMLKKSVHVIASGNFNENVNFKSKDEIGQLARDFNKMRIKLKKSTENIQQKVEERTSALKKLNRLMMGREFRMIELKKEIQKLKNQSKKHG